MFGECLYDLFGLEGVVGSSVGFGLLVLEMILEVDK